MEKRSDGFFSRQIIYGVDQGSFLGWTAAGGLCGQPNVPPSSRSGGKRPLNAPDRARPHCCCLFLGAGTQPYHFAYASKEFEIINYKGPRRQLSLSPHQTNILLQYLSFIKSILYNSFRVALGNGQHRRNAATALGCPNRNHITDPRGGCLNRFVTSPF